MDKSEVSRLTAYLEIVEQLMKQHIEEETVFKNFSVNAARPLIAAKGDERTDMLNKITADLKDGKQIKKLEYSNNKPQPTPEKVKEAVPSNIKTSQKKPVFPVSVPPDPVTGPIPSDPTKPIQPSLADRERQREMAEAGKNQCGEACPDCPDQCKPITCDELKKAITDTTGKVSHSTDIPAYVNPGPSVTVNPVIINDTYRQSPFQTAAQLMAHDKDPLGIGPAPVVPLPVPTEKTAKELFLDACQSAYEHGKPDFKLAIDELMRYHPSWKDVGTVIYFCVTDPKEAIVKKK